MTDPVQQIRALNLGNPPWAQDSEQDTDNQWTYRTSHLTSRAVRDLGFLLVNGWDVTIHARSSQLAIRVTRKDTP
jgi:hypothetical protein